MKCFFTGLTDPGILRSVNQDAYYIDPIGRFFLVADGMGGHAGGQEASRIATQIIRTSLNDNWSSPESSRVLLETAFLKANQAIVKDQRSHPERGDMGTTAVVVMFRKEPNQPEGTELAWCAHVGDSRLYRLRGAKLEQITEDHTWVARAMKMGELSPDQVRTHPWRHVLSQCLGREDLHQVDIQTLEVQVGDRLLLCSDGLTEELSDHLIASHLKSIRASDKAVAALVNAAKEKGGRDNITVVLITIDVQAPTVAKAGA
ncbi:serine/threonine protein phosphatase [Neosynechococcus sphagnicola sy1]|uniref:Serine/threonine protein phosphatase n=1 Tax=Neosynechococcus sphagnicola sy1 TaxID=1497020 RepID=A0A098TMG1_9CYAN|nr:PP2C family serine/threonine-protein phosphatase [Neosynechococcus sphagnicola]KGF73456.1 serine/threonine protein phosphatase [Neosynechococcus sphagnicola sy1]